jgi:hypothetical protein
MLTFFLFPCPVPCNALPVRPLPSFAANPCAYTASSLRLLRAQEARRQRWPFSSPDARASQERMRRDVDLSFSFLSLLLLSLGLISPLFAFRFLVCSLACVFPLFILSPFPLGPPLQPISPSSHRTSPVRLPNTQLIPSFDNLKYTALSYCLFRLMMISTNLCLVPPNEWRLR